MALFGFERETLLDLTVNFIPLGIIAFFIAAFAVVPAFGFDPVFSGLQFLLMISMFVLLAILTYYAGRAIEGAEAAEGNVDDATATVEPEGEVEGLDDTGHDEPHELDEGVSAAGAEADAGDSTADEADSEAEADADDERADN